MRQIRKPAACGTVRYDGGSMDSLRADHFQAGLYRKASDHRSGDIFSIRKDGDGLLKAGHHHLERDLSDCKRKLLGRILRLSAGLYDGASAQGEDSGIGRKCVCLKK